VVAALKTIWRFISIGVIGFGFVLLYGFLRLGTLFIWSREKRRKAVGRIRGRLLRWWMTILGATFIKLGQVLSARPDLVSAEVIGELRLLQDRVPAFATKQARRAIERELGGPISEFFSELDDVPVAAASVAQVHRGVLVSGEEVAVKVLRPNVRKAAARDGAFFRALARMMTVFPAARMSDPVGHATEFVRGILEQTDLRNEATNYQRFGENFEGFAGVHFPIVHHELCGEQVLTMEFMRGEKIDELGEGEFSTLAEITSTMFLKMCFEDGFVHADLHPGNVLVTAEHDLVVFDVGLIKKLSDDILEQFIDFSKCLAVGDSKDFVAHLRRFHTYLEDVDWEQVELDCDKFVGKYRGQNVETLEMGEFINEVFALARRHRIRPEPDLTLVMVGIVTSEGIAKMINPNNNTFEQMAGFLAPIVAKRGLEVSG